MGTRGEHAFRRWGNHDIGILGVYRVVIKLIYMLHGGLSVPRT